LPLDIVPIQRNAIATHCEIEHGSDLKRFCCNCLIVIAFDFCEQDGMLQEFIRIICNCRNWDIEDCEVRPKAVAAAVAKTLYNRFDPEVLFWVP
jgi:hypothetical protein